MVDDDPEPFEVLGAPPLAPFSSIEQALAPAINASLSRHPDARPSFIGMHLLARLQGEPLPDAPPRVPRSPSDPGLPDELRSLEGMLTEALNRVRGQGPSGSLLENLAVRLIDRMDDDRKARATRYTDAQLIWDQLASGDVVLVRASWLLKRAGFRPLPVERSRSCTACTSFDTFDEESLQGVRAWAPREPPQPLPRRQDLERDFPEAIMPLEELRRYERRFHSIAREAVNVNGAGSTAQDEGVAALPVVSVSHCWESPGAPDPYGRTLRMVAAELADGGWDAFDERGLPTGAPTCGVPLYRCWGFEDIGVFWDWCSLYQAPRTQAETASFRRAFAQQDLYFAHQLITYAGCWDLDPGLALPPPCPCRRSRILGGTFLWTGLTSSSPSRRPISTCPATAEGGPSTRRPCRGYSRPHRRRARTSSHTTHRYPPSFPYSMSALAGHCPWRLQLGQRSSQSIGQTEAPPTMRPPCPVLTS